MGKLFPTKVYLARHIKINHISDEEKPYRCEQCGKGFIDRVILEMHMNVHLGLKPFKCRYCDNFYQNISNQNAHERKAHPELYTTLGRQARVAIKVNSKIKRVQ